MSNPRTDPIEKWMRTQLVGPDSARYFDHKDRVDIAELVLEATLEFGCDIPEYHADNTADWYGRVTTVS